MLRSHMKQRTRYILFIATALLFAALLLSYLIPEEIEQPTQPPMIMVMYIIPDGFNGVVVVRYGTGDPGTAISNRALDITVPPNGEVMLPFALPELAHASRARYASGKPIPRPVDNPAPETVVFYPSTAFGDVHGPINTEVFVIGTEAQFKRATERDTLLIQPGPFN